MPTYGRCRAESALLRLKLEPLSKTGLRDQTTHSAIHTLHHSFSANSSLFLPTYLCLSGMWSGAKRWASGKAVGKDRNYSKIPFRPPKFIPLESRNKTGWQKYSFTIPLPCIRCAIISWTQLRIWPKQRSQAIREKLISPDDWKGFPKRACSVRSPGLS